MGKQGKKEGGSTLAASQKKKGKGRPSSFIVSLLAALADPNSTAIKWSKDGTQVEIVDWSRFASKVVPRFFPKWTGKHRDTAIKNFNNYGFIGVHEAQKKKSTYTLPGFTKLEKESCRSVQRVRNLRGAKNVAAVSDVENMDTEEEEEKNVRFSTIKPTMISASEPSKASTKSSGGGVRICELPKSKASMKSSRGGMRIREYNDDDEDVRIPAPKSSLLASTSSSSSSSTSSSFSSSFSSSSTFSSSVPSVSSTSADLTLDEAASVKLLVSPILSPPVSRPESPRPLQISQQQQQQQRSDGDGDGAVSTTVHSNLIDEFDIAEMLLSMSRSNSACNSAVPSRVSSPLLPGAANNKANFFPVSSEGCDEQLLANIFSGSTAEYSVTPDCVYNDEDEADKDSLLRTIIS